MSNGLRAPRPCPGLLQLLGRRDLVVARLAGLVDVYADELAENDGSEVPPPGARRRRRRRRCRSSGASPGPGTDVPACVGELWRGRLRRDM